MLLINDLGIDIEFFEAENGDIEFFSSVFIDDDNKKGRFLTLVNSENFPWEPRGWKRGIDLIHIMMVHGIFKSSYKKKYGKEWLYNEQEYTKKSNERFERYVNSKGYTLDNVPRYADKEFWNDYLSFEQDAENALLGDKHRGSRLLNELRFGMSEAIRRYKNIELDEDNETNIREIIKCAGLVGKKNYKKEAA